MLHCSRIQTQLAHQYINLVQDTGLMTQAYYMTDGA